MVIQGTLDPDIDKRTESSLYLEQYTTFQIKQHFPLFKANIAIQLIGTLLLDFVTIGLLVETFMS